MQRNALWQSRGRRHILRTDEVNEGGGEGDWDKPTMNGLSVNGNQRMEAQCNRE